MSRDEENEDIAIVLYESDERNILKFTPTENRTIAPQLLVRKPDIGIVENCILLTENMYRDIFGKYQDTTVNENSDEDDTRDTAVAIRQQIVGEKRGHRRTTRVPAYLHDYY